MALYWRVKKWTITGAISVSLTYFDSPNTTLYDANGTLAATDIFILDSDENEATNEHDLLSADMGAPFHALFCAGIGLVTLASFPWTIHGGATTQTGANIVSGPAFIDSGYALFDVDTENFSPPMSGFGLSVPIIGGPANLMTVSIECFRTPVTVLSGTGPVDLKKPGTLLVSPGIAPAFTIPLQLTFRPTGEAVGSALSAGVGSAAFTMTATEFWPYANSVGAPVYDSGSGAQLNDPFG